MTGKDFVKLIIDDKESEIQYVDIDTYKHRITIYILSEDEECKKFEKMLEDNVEEDI
jgi:hypothetical protein